MATTVQILTADRLGRRVMESELIELRCSQRGCGALLIRVSNDTRGLIEGFCPRCKRRRTFELKD